MSKRRKQPSPQSALAPESSSQEHEPKPKFEIRFTEDAGVDVKHLDGSIRQQLKKVLEKKLAIDPEGYGLPLRGPLAKYWKHEFATHRVIYRIYPDHKTVAVCAVGPRKRGDNEDVYKQLDAVIKSGRLASQVASVLSTFLPKRK
jgi:mRNA-degrading endonuclease RelE of RelBE toxin-antitoxin system